MRAYHRHHSCKQRTHLRVWGKWKKNWANTKLDMATQQNEWYCVFLYIYIVIRFYSLAFFHVGLFIVSCTAHTAPYTIRNKYCTKHTILTSILLHILLHIPLFWLHLSYSPIHSAGLAPVSAPTLFLSLWYKTVNADTFNSMPLLIISLMIRSPRIKYEPHSG